MNLKWRTRWVATSMKSTTPKFLPRVCGIHLKRHSSRCYRGRTEREIFHTTLYCRTRYTQSLCDLCNGVGTLSIVPINCWRIYTRTTTEVVFTAMAEPIRRSISCAFTYHIFWSTMGALFFRVWSLIILWDTTYAWLTVCYSTPQEHIWPLSQTIVLSLLCNRLLPCSAYCYMNKF